MELNKMVLSKEINDKYIICMNDYKIDSKESYIIYVTKRREIEIILFMLKESVVVYEPSVFDVDIINWLSGKTSELLLNDISIYGTEFREFYNILEKIPISKKVNRELKKNSKVLNKDFVHKRNTNNVLLSESFKFDNSNLLFFNAFTKTDEIVLDHMAEDHVEGLLLDEICRQAAIASINLCMDSSKVFVLIEEKKIYKKFIDRNKTIKVKVFAIGEKEGLGFCVINIIQDESICLKALMRGRNFESKTDYIKK